MAPLSLARAARPAAAALLVMLAVWGLTVINRSPRNHRIDAAARAQLTRLAHGSEADGPRVLVAGDSHAVAIAAGPLCGEVPAQGGIGGVTTAAYATAWASLPASARYRTIVLALGTNDQHARRHPERARNARAARAAMRELIDAMAARTDALIVLAVPPNVATRYPMASAGIRERNGWLAGYCARTGCRYLDPFAESRAADGETMRPGYAQDGVHYDTYEPIRAELSKNICPVTLLSEAQKN